MKVILASRKALADNDTCQDIRDRIYFALSRFSPVIERVTVQIADLRPASTSVQRLCRLSIRLKRLGSFSVDWIDEEVAKAVTGAANHAAGRVERILDRQNDLTRPA